jgi:hypothetical protein
VTSTSVSGGALDLLAEGKVYRATVNVTVLHVAECPNTAALIERLSTVLGPRGVVAMRTVSTEADAAALGMHGSPTLLIDGCDPFVGSPEASLSCRLYQTEDGVRGLPSVAQLRAALTDEATDSHGITS